MKSFLAMCLVFSVAAADWTAPTREKILEFRKECMKSANLSEENMAKITGGQYPDEEFFHCYIRCAMNKAGVWDDSTGFNSERSKKLLEVLGTNVSLDAVESCNLKNIDNQNLCTSAYKGYKCLLDNKLFTPIKSA